MALTMSKDEFQATLKSLWARSDSIFFEVMTREGLFTRPIDLRNPLVFYLGHLPGFNYIHVKLRVCGEQPFNAKFDAMFERGIDPDVTDPTKCHSHSEIPSQWPPLEVIQEYVDRTRKEVLESYDQVSALALTNKFAAKGAVYHLAFEHEIMHQETFYYMYQQLDKKYKIKPTWVAPYKPSGPGVKVRSKKLIAIPAGKVQMGVNPGDIEFGWDNEFPAHVVDVPAFGIDDLNVTNGEFLEFITSGEYEKASNWRPQDWEWKTKFGLKHPVFWGKKDSGEYVVKCVFGEEIDLNEALAWPVFVSWAEASAYAHWKGRSLPSEQQWQRAAYTTPDGAITRKYPWGDSKPTEEHGNFNWVNFGPTPAGSHPKSASGWGVEDLIGDAWEWTCTPFGPFPGFQAMENYPGYSSDFFDDKHFVMKGASWATHEKVVRASFRNWYQDRYPYHFGKFRLVSN